MKIKLMGSQKGGGLFAALFLVGIMAGTGAKGNLTPVSGAPAYTSAVEIDGNLTNPLGGAIIGTYTEIAFDTTTGYDFYLQVHPTTWPGGFLDKVGLFTLGGYNVYTLGYESSAITLSTPVSQLSGVASFGTPNAPNPISADMAGTTAEFIFTSSAAGGVDNGQYSDWLVIDTDSHDYSTLGALSASDGVTATSVGLIPAGTQVPETKNVLFGLAIATMIGVGFIRRKTGLFASPAGGTAFAV